MTQRMRMIASARQHSSSNQHVVPPVLINVLRSSPQLDVVRKVEHGERLSQSVELLHAFDRRQSRSLWGSEVMLRSLNNRHVGARHFALYSGTSDNGHSEEWTTSLQWTNCSLPALLSIHFYPWRRDNLWAAILCCEHGQNGVLCPLPPLGKHFHCMYAYTTSQYIPHSQYID